MKIKYMVLCSKGNEIREANVRKIQEQIPELEIVYCTIDNVFSAHVASFDLDDDYDGLVMLEDDILLCKNFKERVEKLIEAHPYEVVSMFESACSKNELHSEYRPGSKFAWNQCNYYPRAICKILCDPSYMIPFIQWFDKRNEPWGYPIDIYISYVLGLNKIKYWMEVPFLVQHLDFKSNFKGRPTNRQSKYFIDNEEE